MLWIAISGNDPFSLLYRKDDLFSILELDSAPHESDAMRGIHSLPPLLCRESEFES